MPSPQSISSGPVRKPPPKQARAAAKRAAILSAAEKLLSDYAPADVTTRRVADAAGVPIGSIYRYFENVDALFLALFIRMNAGTIQTLNDIVLNERQDWRAHVDQTFDHLEAMHASHPAYGALMAHVDRGDREDDEITSLLTALLSRTLPDTNRALIQDITRTVIAMLDGVEASLFRLPEADRSAAFAQARIAVTAYLSYYLEPS